MYMCIPFWPKKGNLKTELLKQLGEFGEQTSVCQSSSNLVLHPYPVFYSNVSNKKSNK